MGWSWRPLLYLLVGATFCFGCKKIPTGRDAVVKVSVNGVPREARESISSGIATRANSRFLFFIAGVYDWKTFDETALDADVERIERELRRAGYYEARVAAARVVREAENKVRVEIDVDPGPRISIGKLTLEGLSALPFDAAMHATRSLPLKLGAPFDESAYEDAKITVANALADVGYAHVRVSGHAEIHLARREALVTISAEPGPRATLGEVRIDGLHEVPEGVVRQTLQLSPGDSYSRADLGEARAALFRLGVFSRVDVIPNLANPQSEVIPITVRVEEGALKSVSASAGANLDVQRLSGRVRVGWSHRNFLGGLRKFSVSTQPGATLFPTRIDNIVWPTNVFPENYLTASLEQPALFGGRTTGLLSASYNVYPLLYPLPPPTLDAMGDPVPVDWTKENVVGYNEIALKAGLEHPYFSGRLPVTLSMNWQANFPFAYQGVMVDGLSEVIVAYPELDVIYDLRDNPIAPTKGIVFQTNLQTALPLFGSSITDLRLRPEVRAYVPLDFRKKLILAARYTMGFLFSNDYGNDIGKSDYTDPAVVRDQHTMLFRAFYSGGPSSNRGYPYQSIGPQGTVGFLVPNGTDCNVPPEYLPTTCLRPFGGFTLWEASLELRYHLTGPWGLVGFADTSDVGLKGQGFDFATPHLSVGTGLRYASPIGPIRVDVGFRVPGMQKLNPAPQQPPDISEIEPYSTQKWYQGFALHILIGEAF